MNRRELRLRLRQRGELRACRVVPRLWLHHLPVASLILSLLVDPEVKAPSDAEDEEHTIQDRDNGESALLTLWLNARRRRRGTGTPSPSQQASQ